MGAPLKATVSAITFLERSCRADFKPSYLEASDNNTHKIQNSQLLDHNRDFCLHRRKLPPNSGGADGPSPPLSSLPLLPSSPLSSLPLPSPPFPSPPLPFPLLRSRAPQIQLGGRIWCILALKSVIWWQQF